MKGLKYLKMKLYNPHSKDFSQKDRDRIKEAAPSDSIAKVHVSNLSKLFKRNQWLKIKNDKQVIFRIVRGAAVTGLTADHIWMSYDSQLELGLLTEKGREVELVVLPANILETYILAPWNTPNPVERNLYRVATVLGLISVLLGLIGLLS